MSESYLLILGDRQAIAWVLREQRMAFPATSRVEVNRLAVGDDLLIYTTRGAYRNPTRDRGRVIGTASSPRPSTSSMPLCSSVAGSFRAAARSR